MIDFILDHIINRFRVPKEITCDNIPQFVGSKVTQFFEGLKIKRITSTLYPSSANGKAESTSKTLIQNIKKKLEHAKGNDRRSYLEYYGLTRPQQKPASKRLSFLSSTVQKI